MVATKPRDWQEINPHYFPDTRTGYFDKIIKLTGSILCAIVTYRILLRILTGKIHPQIKLKGLRKVLLCIFRQLVY